ncbi:hypothetical protein [Rhodococcus sp. IEGM 1318]|uniref:hypothetical protein n=1 Tax=Rhodococcus sp. IEGM 1318 TaxID=3082226 RepID=UPI0029538309|nr:hypothetical protein [Rhodococcus sp. IEGM 1318]MDV8006779.1 hypothetical protein [Rhodococcus sp. IEGM 1318]
MGFYTASEDAKKAQHHAMQGYALAKDEGVRNLSLAVQHLAKSVEELALQLHRNE